MLMHKCGCLNDQNKCASIKQIEFLKEKLNLFLSNIKNKDRNGNMNECSVIFESIFFLLIPFSCHHHLFHWLLMMVVPD